VRLTLGFHLEHASDIFKKSVQCYEGNTVHATYEIIEEKKEPCPTGPATEML
jgi:hypothetical protein